MQEIPWYERVLDTSGGADWDSFSADASSAEDVILRTTRPRRTSLNNLELRMISSEDGVSNRPSDW